MSPTEPGVGQPGLRALEELREFASPWLPGLMLECQPAREALGSWGAAPRLGAPAEEGPRAWIVGLVPVFAAERPKSLRARVFLPFSDPRDLI
jgi:hypothetical protein